MNLLQDLFKPTQTAPKRSPEFFTELPSFPEIQPLWANFAEVQAVVTQTIAPQILGRVKFRGTRWRALSDRPYPLTTGTRVQVIGRHRTNILIVAPMDSATVA